MSGWAETVLRESTLSMIFMLRSFVRMMTKPRKKKEMKKRTMANDLYLDFVLGVSDGVVATVRTL